MRCKKNITHLKILNFDFYWKNKFFDEYFILIWVQKRFLQNFDRIEI